MMTVDQKENNFFFLRIRHINILVFLVALFCWKNKWAERTNLANCKNLPHICRQGAYFQPTHLCEAPDIAKVPAELSETDRNGKRMKKAKNS